jgi:GNAT superfamily N-acetyltransferase
MTMTTEIRRVNYRDILDAPNAQQLIDEYGAECSIPLIGKIDQQPQIYAALEAAGIFHCFGVYAGDELVGFASILASVLPHYGQKVASVESLFLASAYRPGCTGKALMAAIESHARLLECVAIVYTAPINSALAMVLLATKPYALTNAVFCKRLA